jgi:hypothetical protein
MLLFSDNRFEIGFDEPEVVTIETHEQLVAAYIWISHSLRDYISGTDLAFELFKQNLRKLLRHAEVTS